MSTDSVDGRQDATQARCARWSSAAGLSRCATGTTPHRADKEGELEEVAGFFTVPVIVAGFELRPVLSPLA
jgi:hypothetical protein